MIGKKDCLLQIFYLNTRKKICLIIKYLNGTCEDVDFTLVSEKFNDEIAKIIFDAISVTNEINTDKYEKILVDLGYQFDRYLEDKISDEKIDVLINEKILAIKGSSDVELRNNTTSLIANILANTEYDLDGLAYLFGMNHSEKANVHDFIIKFKCKMKSRS